MKDTYHASSNFNTEDIIGLVKKNNFLIYKHFSIV